MTDKKVQLSRPKDDSFEAYKAWMTEFIDRLLGKGSAAEFSEERWKRSWKNFQQNKNAGLSIEELDDDNDLEEDL